MALRKSVKKSTRVGEAKKKADGGKRTKDAKKKALAEKPAIKKPAVKNPRWKAPQKRAKLSARAAVEKEPSARGKAATPTKTRRAAKKKAPGKRAARADNPMVLKPRAKKKTFAPSPKKTKTPKAAKKKPKRRATIVSAAPGKQSPKKSAKKFAIDASGKSIAHLKGWETRRRRAREKILDKRHERDAKTRREIERGENVPTARKDWYELDQLRQRTLEKMATGERLTQSEYTRYDGWVRKDGTTAVQYSVLRNHPDRDKIIEELSKAGPVKNQKFMDKAIEIMGEYPGLIGALDEIYTVFISP